MQVDIEETHFQKEFLKLMSKSGYSEFKNSIHLCNSTGKIDHRLTNKLYNDIFKEIDLIKSTLKSLEQETITKKQEIIKIKTRLLTEELPVLPKSIKENSVIIERYYNYIVNKKSAQISYMEQNFLSHMELLFHMAGVYEEFYIINAISLLKKNFTLSYKENSFQLSKNNQVGTFQVFPVYFLIKHLLVDSKNDFIKKKVLEFLLKKIYDQEIFLMTISDDEEIRMLLNHCNLTYLTPLSFKMLENNESIILPKILNISRLAI